MKEKTIARQNSETLRLKEDFDKVKDWRNWGPYLSDRQWGTVREDYSPDGSAWDYFPHDMARSRAYRWGEDGIGGFSDSKQLLCMGLVLWNGKDAILKERYFGLTNSEGNHGEDCKELYYYLDGTPTNSYLKMLYKYPHAEYPYGQLVQENRQRSKEQDEFELIDTGLFNDDKYFDVFIEYAKADTDDILMLVTAHNRGSEKAKIHLLPQIWFRNTWSWFPDSVKPSITCDSSDPKMLITDHPQMKPHYISFELSPEFLFCDNETNKQQAFGQPNEEGYFKDAFHQYVIGGKKSAVNPNETGTKAAAHYEFLVPGGQSVQLKIRLSKNRNANAFDDFDEIFQQRKNEADEFYNDVQSEIKNADERLVQRQAFGGMIWSKQFFYYDVPQWLNGDPTQPKPPESRKNGRNSQWSHLNNADIISMPDKWEYPWYAAWDLAFHTVSFAMIDPEFAKQQLVLMTREWYTHPNGQMPAYEWAFGDVNPPVHAWATWKVFEMDRKKNGGTGDLFFLERVLHKLMLNFTWWVNRKDADGRNIFQGGFLGLDNIGVFDRSAPLPTGGHINQSDGTSWMAMYCLNLMRISLELSLKNKVYEDIATKFFEHFLHIAEAMASIGNEEINLWDEKDEFFYDVLTLPNKENIPLRVRSLVGLIPLFAVEVLDLEFLNQVPEFKRRMKWFLKYRPDLAALVSKWDKPGQNGQRLLSLLRGHRMKCLLKRLLDESEFLSPYGIRSLSRFHLDNPYKINVGGQEFSVKYLPAESDSGLFGGNSSWRGSIWFPVNYLIIESLRNFHKYYGDDFKVECPVGSKTMMSLNEVADEISRRLKNIFVCDEKGHRAVFKYSDKMQSDPQFRNYVLFHEYFHGDSGRGVGATHQTGWTGLITALMDPNH